MRAFASVALALVVGLAASVGGAFAGSDHAASGHTALTITFWEDAQRSTDPIVWTLRCDPARGTHPRPELACRRLQAGGWTLVAPVPAGQICTEIYGGPQVGRIVGTLEGRKVWARFTRTNGCHIARWNRLSPWLLPAGGVR
jgi:Subtilisin inhibitor-like